MEIVVSLTHKVILMSLLYSSFSWLTSVCGTQCSPVCCGVILRNNRNFFAFSLWQKTLGVLKLAGIPNGKLLPTSSKS